MIDSKNKAIMDWIEDNSSILERTNAALWEYAETAFEEKQSSEYLKKELKDYGFRIFPGAKRVPTSFVAEWGSGKPVIGLLAEYDALPGLSQERSTECKPHEIGAPGHACGHCTLGTAVLGAALALKVCMEENHTPGTIRFYGCPAEETVEGKVFMSRDHLFDDCDAALSWHPNDVSYVWARKSIALYGMKYTFQGTSAHAGLDPWNGRSAADAVELMNIGANYLREHIPPSCRIQYVITDGGTAPNTVPDHAQVWYILRAPDSQILKDLHKRVTNLAKGAALMTETTFKESFVSGCYDFLPNTTLSHVILKHFHDVGTPKWTQEDLAFADELYRKVPKANIDSTCDSFHVDPEDAPHGLVKGFFDGLYNKGIMGASTDLGDVSWQIPVGCFSYAATVLGAPGHSWFYTATCGTGIGVRGACAAAKVLALTGWDLLNDQELLLSVKEEHQRHTAERKYACPLEQQNNE